MRQWQLCLQFRREIEVFSYVLFLRSFDDEDGKPMEDNKQPQCLSLCQPCKNNMEQPGNHFCESATGATTLYRLRCFLDAIQFRDFKLDKAFESQRNQMKLVRFAVLCFLLCGETGQRGDPKLCFRRRLPWKSDAVGSVF